MRLARFLILIGCLSPASGAMAPAPYLGNMGNGPQLVPTQIPSPADPTYAALYAAGWSSLGNGMWMDPVYNRQMSEAEAIQTVNARGY
jgi:hypothetical protein